MSEKQKNILEIKGDSPDNAVNWREAFCHELFHPDGAYKQSRQESVNVSLGANLDRLACAWAGTDDTY